MALFKDKNFHVHSVTVHTRNTKMRKWLIHRACLVQATSLNYVRYRSLLPIQIYCLIGLGLRQRRSRKREFALNLVVFSFTQGSFPRGTTGNGVPTLILAVGTPFPHLFCKKKVIRNFGRKKINFFLIKKVVRKFWLEKSEENPRPGLSPCPRRRSFPHLFL